jgi:hypothetical protein
MRSLPFGSRRQRGNFPDAGPAAHHLYAVDRGTPSSSQKSSDDSQVRPSAGPVCRAATCRPLPVLPLKGPAMTGGPTHGPDLVRGTRRRPSAETLAAGSELSGLQREQGRLAALRRPRHEVVGARPRASAEAARSARASCGRVAGPAARRHAQPYGPRSGTSHRVPLPPRPTASAVAHGASATIQWSGNGVGLTCRAARAC